VKTTLEVIALGVFLAEPLSWDGDLFQSLILYRDHGRNKG